MRLDNPLQFEINGTSYPFCSFSFSQQLDAPCGTFELKVGEPGGLYDLVGAEVLLRFGAWSRACILDAIDITWPDDCSLSGRDRTSLIVDSSAEVVSFPGKQTFLSIATKLCAPFGISVQDPSNSGRFEVRKFSVDPGDSVFETLEKVAKAGGVFLNTTDGKSLSLFSKKSAMTREISALSPLTKLHIHRNVADVFGKYVARVETKGMWGKPAVVTLKDSAGNKHKWKLVSISDDDDPHKSVALEAIMRRAKSKSVSFSMPGLVEYRLGDEVRITMDGFSDKGMITNIEYEVSIENGEQTTITMGDM